jgi:hypothetical protein
MINKEGQQMSIIFTDLFQANAFQEALRQAGYVNLDTPEHPKKIEKDTDIKDWYAIKLHEKEYNELIGIKASPSESLIQAKR